MKELLKNYFYLARTLPLKVMAHKFYRLLAVKIWLGKPLWRGDAQPTGNANLMAAFAVEGIDPLTVPYDRDRLKRHIEQGDMRPVFLAKARDAAAHEFDLLGSGKVRVDYYTAAPGLEGHRYQATPARDEAARVKNEMGRLLNEAGFPAGSDLRQRLDSYEPIDWHVDFKSGYRWNPVATGVQLPIGRLPGVDVKVPWELSRFQHALPLALTDLIEGGDTGWGAEFILQVADWVAANPGPLGVNWRCTMDVAIRAVNWLWGWALLKDHGLMSRALGGLLLGSLHRHGRHIEENLEFFCRGYHGNHYLANLAGLIYLGAFIPGYPESDRWLAFGLQELVAEMKHQVYPDGVCFEGSTSYHRLVAEIFYSSTAVALNLTAERRQRLKRYEYKEHRVNPPLLPYAKQEFDLDKDEIFPDWYLVKLERMAGFIMDITKSNGKVFQLGDNDNGRLHKITPVLLSDGRAEEFNDHRHILALAGRLFGRRDFLEAGKSFALDGELLLGQVSFLPLTIEADRPAVAKTALVSGTAKRLTGRTKMYSEITIEAGRKGRCCAGSDLPEVRYYPDGGIAVYRNGCLYLAIGCARNGLGGIGAHNHNDKLSFELNVSGVDFFVDGGTYVYTPLPELRNAFRSTWSHNTVAVKGKEQNKILPGHLFVLTDRSKPAIMEVTGQRFIGLHRGYGFGHTRELLFDHEKITIIDKLEKQCEAYLVLNLHPDVRIRRRENCSIILDNKDRSIKLKGNIGQLRIGNGFYSEHYGARQDSKRLIIPLRIAGE